MRRFYVFLMSLLILMNTGCALTKISAAPEMEKNKVTIVDDGKQGEAGESSDLEEEISTFLEKTAAFKSVGGKAFEVHELYGTAEEGKRLLAYIWSRMQEYAVDSGKLSEGSGYSMPLVVELNKDGEKGYKAVSYEAPQDGGQYKDSVKRLFPAEYQEKILERSNVKELDKIVRQKALNYYKLSEEPVVESSPEVKASPDSGQQPGNEGTDNENVSTKTDSGTYVGLIDNNSIEIRISGVPLEKAARAFRLSDEVKKALEKLSLKEGEQVLFNYYINKYEQMIITDIKKLTN